MASTHEHHHGHQGHGVAHAVKDPVCGMTVDVASAVYRSTFQDTTYYFCSAGCLTRFEEDPARFAAAVPG